MTTQDNIRQLREQQQWSQEEMAEKLGMSKNGYAKIERGESDVSLTRLEQIANILNIDIADIVKSESKNLSLLIGNNHGNYGYQVHQTGSNEIELLQLKLEHKDELLAQKDKEIQALKKIIDLMQQSSQ
ncbi:MAG: helix-turn-helix transcriptional regulator [Acinetobacter sp.]|nr:helix-turn-helix transcriptional regulator [Acinetobacter sp.]